LKLATSQDYLKDLESLGQRGADALRAATPVLTGETASEWFYAIDRQPNEITISWYNDEKAGTAPLAVMLQLGHGTRNGGYVEGIDYINPAMKPIFDQIAQDAWNVIVNAS
jgi:hypothetical protein